jgi:hypothetical protein
MRKILKLAVIRASCSLKTGKQLYWLLSRNQVEFVLYDLEVVAAGGGRFTANYLNIELPVVRLEAYYGLPGLKQKGKYKYIVASAVNRKGELVRVILQISYPVQLLKVAEESPSPFSLELPERGKDVLGIYSFAENRVMIMPDLVRIAERMNS